MKALTYKTRHTLANFAIVETIVEEPQTGDNDLLVEVKALGISPGDTLIRQNLDAHGDSYIILGYDIAGEVKKAGKNTTGFKPGDHVMAIGDISRQGSYAEFVAVDYRNVTLIPQQAPYTHAASLPVATVTAWEALFRDENKLPEDVHTVLVLGAAGGVGSMALQLLKARTNVKIIATASKPESKEWVEKLGADLVLDHKGDIVSQLKSHGIEQVDMVFAVRGIKESVQWIQQIIRPFGYLSVIEIDTGVEYSGLNLKSVNIHFANTFTRMRYGYKPEIAGWILSELILLVKAGKAVSIGKLVLKGLTPENIKKAHQLIEQGSVTGKKVIDIEV